MQAHRMVSSRDDKKCGERSGRASEHCIVPLELGNFCREDPVREGDAESPNRGGETGRGLRTLHTGQRNRHG